MNILRFGRPIARYIRPVFHSNALTLSSLKQNKISLSNPTFKFCSSNNNKKSDEKGNSNRDEKKQDKKKQQQNQNNSDKQQEKSNFNQYQQQKPQKDPNQPPKSPFAEKFDKFIKYLYSVGQKVIHTKLSINFFIGVAILSAFLYYNLGNDVVITTKEFINLIETNSFDEVFFVQQSLLLTSKNRVKRIQAKLGGQDIICYVLSFDEVMEAALKQNIKIHNVQWNGIDWILRNFYRYIDLISIIFIVLIAGRSFNQQGGGLGKQMGMQMKTKRFNITKNVPVKFDDVAGMQQSKREVQQIVDFLKYPLKYQKLGATIPKGVLLTGPPGTGKTLLAKACAGQAGVPFFSVSGSDFVQVFVGIGASRVRQLFAQAKASAPSIIFIDQIDAIGKKRMAKLGSNDQRQSTLNQLLVEMDGFGTNSSVIIMGATNRKQILDNALTRAGRFDRQVQVNLPDIKGRYEIFLVHLKPLVLSDKFTIAEYAKRLASLTPGFSGAQIANLCNQAAILAARYNKGIVQMLDFQLSSQRVIGGVQRKGFVSATQRKTVAFHQCGHAVVSWFLQGADPLLKVTIIPRSKGALGFAQYFINQNQLQTKQQILDRICFILGGRCAQLHFFKQVTTGAYDDLEKAYDLAYRLIAKFGMYQEQIGYIAFPQTQYLKPYSQQVESKIDKLICKIIASCTERTKQMIKQQEHHILNLAEQLLKKQTIDVRTIQRILGPRPFPPNKTFAAYLQNQSTQTSQKQLIAQK